MLALQAKRLEQRSADQGYPGVFPWMEILQALLPILSSCKKPVTPAPVNPTPNPTAVQQAAWADAWRLKSTAEENWNGEAYTPMTVKRTASPIRKQRRRDGQPVSKAESHAAAIMALDDARSASLEELYSNVLEARYSAGI